MIPDKEMQVSADYLIEEAIDGEQKLLIATIGKDQNLSVRISSMDELETQKIAFLLLDRFKGSREKLLYHLLTFIENEEDKTE